MIPLPAKPFPLLSLGGCAAWLYFDRGHAEYIRADDAEVTVSLSLGLLGLASFLGRDDRTLVGFRV